MACPRRRARAALPYVRVDVAADKHFLLAQRTAKFLWMVPFQLQMVPQDLGINWVQPAGELRVSPPRACGTPEARH